MKNVEGQDRAKILRSFEDNINTQVFIFFFFHSSRSEQF